MSSKLRGLGGVEYGNGEYERSFKQMEFVWEITGFIISKSIGWLSLTTTGE